MMWWDHGGWGAGEWVAMSLMMVVFWGALVALVVWLVRSSRDESDRTTGGQTTTPNADELLAERFARGEIDAEEFTRNRQLLHTGSGRS